MYVGTYTAAIRREVRGWGNSTEFAARCDYTAAICSKGRGRGYKTEEKFTEVKIG